MFPFIFFASQLGSKHTRRRKGCATVRWRATESIHRTVCFLFILLFYFINNSEVKLLLSMAWSILIHIMCLISLLLTHYFFPRALLRKPSLLLCDEVTSSVDALAEREIIDTLRKCSGKHLSGSNSNNNDNVGAEGKGEKQETGPVR